MFRKNEKLFIVKFCLPPNLRNKKGGVFVFVFLQFAVTIYFYINFQFPSKFLHLQKKVILICSKKKLNFVGAISDASEASFLLEQILINATNGRPDPKNPSWLCDLFTQQSKCPQPSEQLEPLNRSATVWLFMGDPGGQCPPLKKKNKEICIYANYLHKTACATTRFIETLASFGLKNLCTATSQLQLRPISFHFFWHLFSKGNFQPSVSVHCPWDRRIKCA